MRLTVHVALHVTVTVRVAEGLAPPDVMLGALSQFQQFYFPRAVLLPGAH
jgi:hypothetical protein